MTKAMRIIGVAALAVAFSAGAAWAQSAERQVRAYLEHGMEQHAALGYARERTIPDVVTPLRLDHPFLWSIYLREGVSYRIYGACDNDCSDLDMEIYGADGNLADRDIATDDTPYVQITPAETGRHYVRTWLYACTAEPCYVAMRAMSGGAPAERAAPPQAEMFEEEEPLIEGGEVEQD